MTIAKISNRNSNSNSDININSNSNSNSNGNSSISNSWYNAVAGVARVVLAGRLLAAILF